MGAGTGYRRGGERIGDKKREKEEELGMVKGLR